MRIAPSVVLLAGCAVSPPPDEGAPLHSSYHASTLALALPDPATPLSAIGDVVGTGIANELAAFHLDLNAQLAADLADGSVALPVQIDTANRDQDPHATLVAGSATFAGEIYDGYFSGATGDALVMPIALSPDILLHPILHGVSAYADDLADDGIGRVTLLGSVEPTFVTDTLAPAFAQLFGELIARDCAGGGAATGVCGCTYDSDGSHAITHYDANGDCIVSVDEVLANASFAGQFEPDCETTECIMQMVSIQFDAVVRR